MFWEWLSINDWIFWLPAIAIAIALLLTLRSKSKTRDWRARVSRKSIPRWTYILIALALLLTLPLFADALVLRGIREFFLPSDYPPEWFRIPIYLQALVFSLIGIPLILQGLAFGWLRRLFTSSVHCPKCNYDLASLIKRNGEAKTTCPECGFSPEPNQPIGKPKKRKRLILAGTLLILIGISLTSYRYYCEYGLSLPRWVIATYASWTGDLRMWAKNPTPLSAARSLKLLPNVVTTTKALRSPTSVMVPFDSMPFYFTPSRDLDLAILQELTKPEGSDILDQALLLIALHHLLSQSVTRPTRISDLRAHTTVLDNQLDRFFTPSGKIRTDLDPVSTLEDYQSIHSPSLTKPFIIAFGGYSTSLKLTISLLEVETDPLLRSLIIQRHLYALPISTSLLQQLDEAGAPESVLKLVLLQLINPNGLQYWHQHWSTNIDASVEARVLAILEAPDSPIYQPLDLTTSDLRTLGARLSNLSMRMSEAKIGLTKPLHAARWQLLLNDLTAKLEQINQLTKPAQQQIAPPYNLPPIP
jgi:hypothetical protein